jgi:hypothetical protein
MKHTRAEVIAATCRWLAANPDQVATVVDDRGVSWAIPRPAREAIELSEAITQARSAISQSARRA